MKKFISILILCSASFVTAANPDNLSDSIQFLQNEWAHIKYQLTDKEIQLDAIRALEAKASEISNQYNDRAEPKIWQAIILSTDAGIANNFSSLSKLKESKRLLESALQIDDKALEGSAHTSLGALYYQAPTWPLSFKDLDKAREHLQKALAMNPKGIDPNYFYGDFLNKQGDYQEATLYLQRAIDAPNRPHREIADAGRRAEAKSEIAAMHTSQ